MFNSVWQVWSSAGLGNNAEGDMKFTVFKSGLIWRSLSVLTKLQTPWIQNTCLYFLGFFECKHQQWILAKLRKRGKVMERKRDRVRKIRQKGRFVLGSVWHSESYREGKCSDRFISLSSLLQTMKARQLV